MYFWMSYIAPYIGGCVRENIFTSWPLILDRVLWAWPCGVYKCCHIGFSSEMFVESCLDGVSWGQAEKVCVCVFEANRLAAFVGGLFVHICECMRFLPHYFYPSLSSNLNIVDIHSVLSYIIPQPSCSLLHPEVSRSLHMSQQQGVRVAGRSPISRLWYKLEDRTPFTVCLRGSLSELHCVHYREQMLFTPALKCSL